MASCTQCFHPKSRIRGFCTQKLPESVLFRGPYSNFSQGCYQVWAADISYIPMAPPVSVSGRGHGPGESLCAGLATVQPARLKLLCRGFGGRPEQRSAGDLQGSQFTGDDFIDVLRVHGVAISMDGRGRFRYNIFVERLWRSLKYEEVYLKAYQNAAEARHSIAAYFDFYNHERLHQALGYRAPLQVFEEATRFTKLRRGRKTARANPS
jgi:putative transposase